MTKVGDKNCGIDKYMSVVDEIGSACTNMMFGVKFKRVNWI